MKIALKIMFVIGVAIVMIYHMTCMRGYFSVGGEIFIPIAIATAFIIGGKSNDKRKKQSRSNC